MAASTRPFMGVTPYIDVSGSGSTFRVWAPFATTVSVAGDFNGWASALNPLFPEQDGYWSVDVPGASVGQEYLFVLTNPNVASPLWHMDPYLRQISRKSGSLHGVIGPTNENIAAVDEPFLSDGVSPGELFGEAHEAF